MGLENDPAEREIVPVAGQLSDIDSKTLEINQCLEALKTVDHIIAVGSVDGVCTAAAVLRQIPDSQRVTLTFCQAFTVDKIDLEKLPAGKIVFVDLAVNTKNPQMTSDFLARARSAGHQIVGVIDEHGAEEWSTACTNAGVDLSAFALQPVSGKGTDTNSSGALLLRMLGSGADSHTRELCQAADAGDRGDFSTQVGGIVNAAVKSAITDDGRRVHLARHLSHFSEADPQIAGWIEEYNEILRNNDRVLAATSERFTGIAEVSTVGVKVDITAIMTSLYSKGYQVVVAEVELMNRATGRMEKQLSFGVPQSSALNLKEIFQNAQIPFSGFEKKATVASEYEEKALQAVSQALAVR
jgi:hypothetical protein